MPKKNSIGAQRAILQELFHPKLFFLAPMGDEVNEPVWFWWPLGAASNGLVISGTTVVDGYPRGKARQFASSDYISIPTSGTAGSLPLITLKPVSILFRIKPTASGQIVSLRGGSQGVISLSGSGPFDISMTPNTTVRMQTSGAPVANNSWNKVAIVRDAANNWTCYVNGSAVTLSTNSNLDDVMMRYFSSTTGTSCAPLFGNGFAGVLDDFRIYVEVLSANDLNKEFNKEYR